MDAIDRIKANRGGYATLDYGDLYDLDVDENGNVIGVKPCCATELKAGDQ